MSPPSRNQLTNVPNPRPPRPHSFRCIGSSAGRHRAAAKPMQVTIRNETTTMVKRDTVQVIHRRTPSRSRAAACAAFRAGLVRSSR